MPAPIRDPKRKALLAAVLPVLLAGAIPAAAADRDPLVGAEAVGGWEQAEPGTRRLIRPADLPEPFHTRSTANAPSTVDKPDGVMPVAMPGFTVREFAAGLDMPRVIAPGPNRIVLVADSGAGAIRAFRVGDDGLPAEQAVFADGLDRPTGIAFHPSAEAPRWVYVADEGSVRRYPWTGGALTAAGEPEVVIPDLPTGGHWTRDIAFSLDGGTLFVAVGSEGNIGGDVLSRPPPAGFVEANPKGAAWGFETERATVLAFNPDGGERRIVATGLRNCSALTVQPSNGALWCVVNERDGLGDDLPPDYATVVEEGAFYGWPWYYIGDNKDPRLNDVRPDLAGAVRVPDVLFQAHSAPLGITFAAGADLPQDWRDDAFVALRGSWNRDRRTGYKLVRLEIEDGRATGVYQDVMTGFVLDDERVWGRPVDVAVAPDGALLLSDDGSGRIWRLSRDETTGATRTE